MFLQKKCVVGEKKITKTFQYDMPGELVVTYLSEVRRQLAFLVWSVLDITVVICEASV